MPRRTYGRVNITVEDFHSVVDWGAVGDGVTDDTEAFNTAISKLSADGGCVLVNEGDFNVPSPAGLTTGGRTLFWMLNGTVNGSWLPALPGTIINLNGYIPDGDKGDITVSATGATWTIDAAAVTTAKVADGAITTAKSANLYHTRADVTTATIDASVDTIRTGGYANAGDGGGALYKRVGSEPSHAFKAQSADGAWWSGIQSASDIQARSTAGGYSEIHVGETYINAREEFGLTGDSTIDDTAKWEEIDANMPNGGTLYLPPGFYKITNPLTLTKPYNFLGDGPSKSTIRYDVDGTNFGTQAAIRTQFTTADTGDIRQWYFKGIRLFLNDVGDGAGGAALELGVDAGATLASLGALIEGCTITGTTEAIEMGEDFQWANIVRNTINGGVNLNGVGDGVLISRNLFFGTNTGVIADILSGSHKVIISHNSFTCQNGAVHVTDADQLDLLYNVFEQSGTNAHSLDMLVAIEGTARISHAGNIIGNNFGGGSNVGYNLRMLGTSGVKGWVVDLNSFKTPNTRDVLLASTAKYNQFRDGNRYYTTGPDYTRARNILDNGEGNEGIDKPISGLYQNSWANATTSLFRKNYDGRVVMEGTASGGTTTAGTVIFQLPAGFRPTKNTDMVVPVFDGTNTHVGQAILDVATTGDVSINVWPSGGTQLRWDQLSFNAVRQVQ